eukprot:TRINITY_DN16429_c0_g1_i1.p1 TRINITY_DN16429_c0_g1~~TRINITY_DN16429_c0_g1_i1.p1  ORF type:complete len:197 (+),score=35.94 TRINITY_DN16429_c0_g1_i1:37-591(+)
MNNDNNHQYFHYCGPVVPLTPSKPRFVFRGVASPVTPDRLTTSTLRGSPVIEHSFCGSRSVERNYERTKKMEMVPSPEKNDASTNTPPSREDVAPDVNGLRLRYSLFKNSFETPTKRTIQSASNSPAALTTSTSTFASPSPSGMGGSGSSSPIQSSVGRKEPEIEQMAPRLSEPKKPSRSSSNG